MSRTRLILNRAFSEAADGFYQLTPFGEFDGSLQTASGDAVPVTQVLSRERIEPIFNRLEASAKDPAWPGLLGDREHWSLTNDKTTEALGWFREFDLRDDGLYAKPKKTELGERLINGGTLRMVSPVFDVVTEDGAALSSGCRVVPVGLDSIGFTNRPRLGKFMKPVTNKNPQQEQPTTSGGIMKLVNKQLGLADDAAEASAVSAIEKLTNRAAQADTLQTELDAATLKVKNMESIQLEAEADAFLVTHTARIQNTDEARATLKALYISNRADAEKLVALLPLKAEAPQAPNRKTVQPKAPTGEGAALISNKQVETYVREHPGVSHISAFQILSSETTTPEN